MTFPTSALTKSRGRITSAWLAFFEASLPNAGRLWNFRNVSASTTVAIRDFCDVDASGGPISLTMPDPSGNEGMMIAVAKADSSSNAVTMVGTVNGTVNPTMTVQYSCALMVSNGTEWRLA